MNFSKGKGTENVTSLLKRIIPNYKRNWQPKNMMVTATLCSSVLQMITYAVSQCHLNFFKTPFYEKTTSLGKEYRIISLIENGKLFLPDMYLSFHKKSYIFLVTIILTINLGQCLHCTNVSIVHKRAADFIYIHSRFSLLWQLCFVSINTAAVSTVLLLLLGNGKYRVSL